MSRPPGSATAAAFESACGSEPTRVTRSGASAGGDLGRVAVVPVREPPLPQPATTSATTNSATVDLATQPDLPDDPGLLLVRDPVGVHRARLAVCKPARPREARPADVRHPPAADVPTRQVLELERRVFERLRRHEQVGAHEQLLRPLRLAHEGHDLLKLGAVADHVPGELLVHVRSVPDGRRVAQRSDDEQRQRDDGHGAGGRDARRAQHVAAEAPEEQHEHGRDGDAVEDRQPGGSPVGSGHQPVQRGERPDGEVEVVRSSPEPVRQPAAVVVRDREREQEFGRRDPESRPERPVARGEGDEQLDEREGQERVGGDRQDMDADERADEKTTEAVDVLEREARPAPILSLAAEREPEADDDAEHDVGGGSRRARRVPDRRARAHVHAGTSWVERAQVSFSTIRPSTPMKRPARPRASSHSGPCSSSRKPVFAATSAARQLAPDAVTCDQHESLGRPVSGSTRCAPREAVPLVARPPVTTRTAPPAGSATSTPPRTARSPPTETKPGPSSTATASSTASAFTTPFRSRASPGGRRSIHPATQISDQRPRSVGSTSPSVSAATSIAIASARAKSGETASMCADDRFTRESSDPGRKRLKASSQRTSTAAIAAGSPPATATSQPMARKRWTATALTTSASQPEAAAPP